MRITPRESLRAAGILTVVLVLAAAGAPARAGGDVSLFYGRRALPEEAWQPVDRPAVYGFSVSFGRQAWPLRLETAYLVSTREEAAHFPIYGEGNIEGVIQELSFGVRSSFRPWDAPIALHAGGGIAYFIEEVGVDAEGPGGKQHDNDTNVGGYARAGASWRVGSRIDAGLDVRRAFLTTFTLEDHFSDPKRRFEADADYLQATLFVSWRWPAE